MKLDLPILTERLELRDFVEGDVAAFYRVVSDPAVMRYMFYGPVTLGETRAYIGQMLDRQRENPRPAWELAVVRRQDNRLIGACDLTFDDDQPGTGDLGYLLGQEAWGEGYATELARALVQAGFEQLALEKIIATCDVENIASARVLEKAGLRRVTRLENHKYAKDRWWTSYLYRLTRAEWAARPATPFAD